MSEITQLKAILAVGFILSVLLMWDVERASLRGKPQHAVTVQTHQVAASPAAH